MAAFNPADWYRLLTANDPVYQGDQLFDVTLRAVIPDPSGSGELAIEELQADVIIVTQTCDLEERKVDLVEVAPTFCLSNWLANNPSWYNPIQLEAIRRGVSASLYLLPGWPTSPVPDMHRSRVVRFDQKRTMTFAEVDEARRGRRIGLQHPYIEHFAQAVARFYMRVGLPESIPPIRWERLNNSPRKPPEKFQIADDQIAEAGLPPATQRLEVEAHSERLMGHPDVIYRSILAKDSNFFGIGDSVEQSINSLLQWLKQRRDEVLQDDTRPDKKHWIIDWFPLTTSEGTDSES